MLPIILLVGHSGVGKDTVANEICRLEADRAVKLALADPIKRIAKAYFEFSDEQLWGVSKFRDIPDPKLSDINFWSENSQKIGYRGYFATKEWSELDSKFKLYDLYRSIYSKHNLESRFYNKSPRDILRFIGETYVNSKDRFFFANYAKQTAKELLSGGYRYDQTKGLIKDEKTSVPSLVIVSDGRHLSEVVTFAESNAKIINILSSNCIEEKDPYHRSVREVDIIDSKYFDSVFVNNKTNINQGIGSLEWKVKELLYSLTKK